jgi:CheY-like chemotaxis protein
MTILLIEDDAIEILKLKRCIAKLGQHHTIEEAHNGEEALALLEGKSFPDLLLLDLNMPKVNGLEFLKRLREIDRLKCLPTVILTTSVNKTDLKAAYALGVAGYIVKPLRYEDYVLKIEVLLNYWKHNELV